MEAGIARPEICTFSPHESPEHLRRTIDRQREKISGASSQLVIATIKGDALSNEIVECTSRRVPVGVWCQLFETASDLASWARQNPGVRILLAYDSSPPNVTKHFSYRDPRYPGDRRKLPEPLRPAGLLTWALAVYPNCNAFQCAQSLLRGLPELRDGLPSERSPWGQRPDPESWRARRDRRHSYLRARTAHGGARSGW